MKRISLVLSCILLLGPWQGSSAIAQAKRPMTVEDLFRFKRVADPQISPDGKHVVYVVTSVDLEANGTNADLWLASTDGKLRKALTTHPKHDRHPRWSPDSKRVVFESNRSGENQLWTIDIDGGEARQLTTIATEASTGIWSPDGKWIAFVSAVYPEYSTKPYAESNALNKKRIDEIAKNPVKAKVHTKLFYRHWDSYVEDKRQHLFVVPADGGEPRDATPGDRDAYPTSMTFSVGDDFTFSPDSKHLVFTAVPKEKEAWSTNHDICRVPLDPAANRGGKFPEDWECLTKDNPAADGAPKFSPDGKVLAYRAQKRPGAEADKWELMVVECDVTGALASKPKSVTAELDRSVDSFAYVTGMGICFTAEESGATGLYVSHIHRDGRVVRQPMADSVRTLGALSAPLHGPADVVTTNVSMSSPAEVIVHSLWLRPESAPRQLSQANVQLHSELDLPRPESVTVPGAGDTPMQMWILKPPGFDPNKKWPVAYLVHGGPQGAWEDGWSFRWNPQLWAAQGYVVVLPNPRGSTGFGQKYVDEISGDWGGKCYEDLMKGVEYLEKLPYIDKDRMAAAGASFGGYMMNWFQGHTTKFKTLITHCGVYNHESMYATTEELWFDEWEHGEGKPLWENREKYLKHSPHRFAHNFKTPMLVIHNDLDFRVPVSEGHQLFTTLQRLGIPSRFINFPDEGHWVLKPANSAYWHKEVFAWLTKYVPPGGR